MALHLDNTMSENVQNIQQNQKLHHEKLEVEISRGENPTMHFLGRLPLVSTIRYSNGAPQ